VEWALTVARNGGRQGFAVFQHPADGLWLLAGGKGKGKGPGGPLVVDGAVVKVSRALPGAVQAPPRGDAEGTSHVHPHASPPHRRTIIPGQRM